MRSIFTCLLLIVQLHCFSQQWKNWNTSNSPIPTNTINDLSIDSSNNVWLATNQGVVKFDGFNWVFYTSSNSPLPHNVCYAIATEGNIVWIGTVWGLVKFDEGTNWTIYTTVNSGLPYNYIASINVDRYGVKWIGTLDAFGTNGGGVTKYDDVMWTTYNTLNSGIASDWAFNTFVDRTNVKWIGTPSGLSVYDDATWTSYTPFNSGIAGLSVGRIKEDLIDSVYWVLNGNGISRFDRTQNSWSVYDTSNSIPDNYIFDVAIDSLNRKWFTSYHTGLAIYDNSSWTFLDTNNVGSFLQYSTNLCFDRGRGLWLTTGSGLVFYGDTILLTNVPVINYSQQDVMELFPNPATNLLNIRMYNFIADVKILVDDIYGKLVMEKYLNRKQDSLDIQIDISNLSSGIYLLRAIINGKELTQKFIIYQ